MIKSLHHDDDMLHARCTNQATQMAYSTSRCLLQHRSAVFHTNQTLISYICVKLLKEDLFFHYYLASSLDGFALLYVHSN